MYAIKAIYDGVNFKPQQPISVSGQYEVVITFLGPLASATESNPRVLRQPAPGESDKLGELDGLIKIPDDFDEPLEEMKEYMY